MISRWLAVALLLLSFATSGCGGAFGAAMDRGDEAAGLGRWDRAADAYEQAARLDPSDEEAREKLRNARRQQAKARVAKAEALLADGKAEQAMQPFFDAMRLDKQNLDAQQGYDKARNQVLTLAEQALAAGQFKEAHRLARHVLLFEPKHDRANTLLAEAVAKIADVASKRAAEHEQQGELALALVDYGEALRYLPTHQRSLTGWQAAHSKLRKSLTYFVALKNFDGEKKTDDFGADVNADTLSQGLDSTLPLRVVSDLPPEAKTGKVFGMRLGGVFKDYRFDRSSKRTTRSCSYVCGQDRVDNPAYHAAESEMKAAQAALGTAEGRHIAAKAAVSPAERARDSAKTRLADRQREVSRLEKELSRCRTQNGMQPGSCSAEEDRLSRAKDDEAKAKDELSNAENAVRSAKDELSSADRELSSKRSDADSTKRTFQATPATVLVDRHCEHKYSVEIVSVAGEVSCALRGEGIYDTEAVLAQTVSGRFQTSDETFPAQSGFCAEVKNGDPLNIPTEPNVRKKVLASAISAVQTELVGAFDRYRKAYFARGKAAAADQKTDQAITELVQFSLLRGKSDKDAAFAEAHQELVRLTGMDDLSISRAVAGVAE